MKAQLTIFALVLLGAAFAHAQPASRDHAAHLGASVMPFDLSRSTHVFTSTKYGGTQDVVSKDGDPTQVALIREHLGREARAFAAGNYADPAAIHGNEMPGLQELQAGAARIHVTAADLPKGGRIRFETRDSRLVAALHRWFAAQVHDHGPDAVMAH